MPKHIEDADTRARVVELYTQGVKLAKITEETGVPRSSIYWILQTSGVEPTRITTRRAKPQTQEETLAALLWSQQRILDLELEVRTLRGVVVSQQATISHLAGPHD